MKKFLITNVSWIVPTIVAILFGYFQIIVTLYPNKIKTIMQNSTTTILWVLIILSSLISIMMYIRQKNNELKTNISKLETKLLMYDIIWNKYRFNNPNTSFVINENDIKIFENIEMLNKVQKELDNLLIIQKGIKTDLNPNFL